MDGLGSKKKKKVALMAADISGHWSEWYDDGDDARH